MRLGICALQRKWRMYGIPVCSGARTCPHQSWWHTGPHVSMGTVKMARRWFGLFFSEEIPPFLRFQYLQLTVVEDRWSGYCQHWVSLIHLFCLTFVNFFFTLSQLWHGDSVSVLSPDPDLGLFFFSWCLHLLDIKKKKTNQTEADEKGEDLGTSGWMVVNLAVQFAWETDHKRSSVSWSLDMMFSQIQGYCHFLSPSTSVLVLCGPVRTARYKYCFFVATLSSGVVLRQKHRWSTEPNIIY